ncbi:MAG: NUDIX domain-containing protein [Desulfovibrio sp.]|jgi:8-oxo-dGTP diphosphatase|nr:NUDIX domain-containing protein [Desulfovibrio sp.]
MEEKSGTDGSIQKSSAEVSWSDLPYIMMIVFCFLIRDGKILLITRANEPYKGTRTIPGGKKWREESLREACIREMQEETGLTVKNLKFAGLLHVIANGDEREYISAYFTSDDCEGELASSSEGDLQWVDFTDSDAIGCIHPSYAALYPLIKDSRTPFNVVLRIDPQGNSTYKYE